MNTATICTAPRSRGCPARLVDYRSVDRDEVVRLLSGLPLLYAGAHEWLDRRLNDVVCRTASCTLARVGNQLAGIAIVTPKAGARVKLSTLFVAPEFRRRGLGDRLVRRCWNRWVLDGVCAAHVTVRIGREDALHSLLAPFGFSFVTRAANRYGVDQHEFVLQAKVVGKSTDELLRRSV